MKNLTNDFYIAISLFIIKILTNFKHIAISLFIVKFITINKQKDFKIYVDNGIVRWYNEYRNWKGDNKNETRIYK